MSTSSQQSPPSVRCVGAQCHRCNRDIADLNRCTGCYSMSYCGRDCQTKAWPNHRDMCLRIRAAANAMKISDTQANQLECVPVMFKATDEERFKLFVGLFAESKPVFLHEVIGAMQAIEIQDGIGGYISGGEFPEGLKALVSVMKQVASRQPMTPDISKPNGLEVVALWNTAMNKPLAGAIVTWDERMETCYIQFMVVHQKCQRKGLGRALCSFLDQESIRRGSAYKDISLLSNNILTKPFWEAIGFLQVNDGIDREHTTKYVRPVPPA